VERVFTPPSEEVLRGLVGEQDNHIRFLEKELGVRVGRNDGLSLLIAGQDAEVQLAEDLLEQLSGVLSKGDTLYSGDFERALKLLAGDRRAKLTDLYREKIELSGKKTSIVPKTQTQKLYLDNIRANDLVFGIGPAGTGKTYLAMAMAVSALLNREVKRIALCRPAVEAGEKLGFLPGDLAEKVNPYLRPLYDALHDMVDFNKANELIEKGAIEVTPLAFMRGRTLSDSFVILDEAQNTTSAQMRMLLTRLGPGTKCVITGDLSQVDLPRGVESGLRVAVNILQQIKGVSIIEFSGADIVRHPLVARIVAAYEKHDSPEAKRYSNE
jgi:phosphate starvation-inducible PhoH-like protein